MESNISRSPEQGLPRLDPDGDVRMLIFDAVHGNPRINMVPMLFKGEDGAEPSWGWRVKLFEDGKSAPVEEYTAEEFYIDASATDSKFVLSGLKRVLTPAEEDGIHAEDTADITKKEVPDETPEEPKNKIKDRRPVKWVREHPKTTTAAVGGAALFVGAAKGIIYWRKRGK